MAQHSNESRHSNEDITIENAQVSIDDKSILKTEYDPELQSPDKETSGLNSDDDYPDGGLTAWLVVCGVRLSNFSILTRFTNFFVFFPALLRRCVIHAQRKLFRISINPRGNKDHPNFFFN